LVVSFSFDAAVEGEFKQNNGIGVFDSSHGPGETGVLGKLFFWVDPERELSAEPVSESLGGEGDDVGAPEQSCTHRSMIITMVIAVKKKPITSKGETPFSK
jgi:hypothetical protein